MHRPNQPHQGPLRARTANAGQAATTDLPSARPALPPAVAAPAWPKHRLIQPGEQLETHPEAAFVAVASEADYLRMKESIRRDGVATPIIIVQGQIADGRHRYRACQELGRPCPADVYPDDTDVRELSLRANLDRCQRSKSQLALMAARMVTTKGKGHPGKNPQDRGISVVTQEQAAVRYGLSVNLVGQAVKLLHEGSPELIEQVDSGRLSVEAALGQLDPNRNRRRVEVARLTEGRPAEAGRRGVGPPPAPASESDSEGPQVTFPGTGVSPNAGRDTPSSAAAASSGTRGMPGTSASLTGRERPDHDRTAAMPGLRTMVDEGALDDTKDSGAPDRGCDGDVEAEPAPAYDLTAEIAAAVDAVGAEASSLFDHRLALVRLAGLGHLEPDQIDSLRGLPARLISDACAIARLLEQGLATSEVDRAEALAAAWYSSRTPLGPDLTCLDFLAFSAASLASDLSGQLEPTAHARPRRGPEGRAMASRLQEVQGNLEKAVALVRSLKEQVQAECTTRTRSRARVRPPA